MSHTWELGHYTYTTWAEDCGCTFTSASNKDDFSDIIVTPNPDRLCDDGWLLWKAKRDADEAWDRHQFAGLRKAAR